MPSAASLVKYFLLLALLSHSFATAQENESDPPEAASDAAQLDGWDRLIYVPFRELQKVFDNQTASAVIPYAQYLEMLKTYLNRDTHALEAPEAVISESRFDARVEQDVVRISVTFRVTVLKEKGWAQLPLHFGSAAVGKLITDDEQHVLLRGVGTGVYELLINKAGQHDITLELLATVKTSPEHRSFELSCPPVGISELTVTIPEADQAVQVLPLQVRLPVEGNSDQQTVARVSLGATEKFEVRWNPAAGSRPVMDLLASVTNRTDIRIEPGLIQSTAALDYEVLRGELTEVSVLVPLDARIIDVLSGNGRIRSWQAEPAGETHQRVRIELLTPVSDHFQATIQTERTPDSETIQLLGRSEDGKLQGVHADGIVRESGQIVVTADPALTVVVKSQNGVKRIDAGGGGKGAANGSRQAWEFSGTSGLLIIQTKPVEPRLLADQNARIVFDDDELRLISRITYTVERAGVFQLSLSYPESLTIDTVRADGMSEFNVDKATGRLTLSLTEKRLGSINVDVTAHKAFDAAAENTETEIPMIVPLGVERDSGQVTLFAPQFLDVVTVDEKVAGLFPAGAADAKPVGRARRVSSWKYTQRPVTLAVRTSPRPAQLAAGIATTASVEPDVVKVTSVLSFEIRNAGIDTFRVSVPAAIAEDIRFRSVSSGHTIQQRDKASAVDDGQVVWTLVLQHEVTGNVQIAADWEIPLQEMNDDAAQQEVTLEPVRILLPFTDEQADKRKVTLTQTRGEIRLLRHQSLSITAKGAGDTIEQIDVRELQLMPQDGYLAFRYFSQPASTTVRIRKHEIHDVVATVVSRAAIEIVTDKQLLASYRCRFRITSSERQRLRIDLPEGADLQAPLLNSSRTTFEAAEGVDVGEGWDAYYVNISREGTSDEEFLLTFQFRCPITESDVYPYESQGGKQILRLPVVGDATGGTVIQETRAAVWGPKDIAFVGEPIHWSVVGRPVWNFWNPLVSPTHAREAMALNDWVGGSSGGEFAQQGHVTVYRALGRQPQLNLVWWNRPFLVAVISAALLFAGFILRRTTWENRLTLTISGCLIVALWMLKDASETMQFLSAGSYGLMAVAGIWLTGLFLGHHSNHVDQTDSPPPDPDTPPVPPDPEPPEPQPDAAPESADAAEIPSWPPGVVVPAPEVTQRINELLGGKS